MNGVNTYTGATIIGGGIVNAGVAGALGTGGAISLIGGTLQFGAGNSQDYSSRFTTIGGQAFNIDTNGQTVTFASNLTSTSGTFTKLGAGTLTLSGNNLYTGATTINAGTLVMTGTNAYSGITLINGGVVSVGADANLGTNATATAITFASGGTGTLRLTARALSAGPKALR